MRAGSSSARAATAASPAGTETATVAVLIDRLEGKRLNRPNDVVCKSDGSIWFTDPGLRVPLAERELPTAGVYRRGIGRAKSRLVAEFEYPNGLAFSPDERVLYVANTRFGAVHPRDRSRQPRAT